QLTADELVGKNIEAKGGASALRDLATLRLTGKLAVQEGQIQLAFLQLKKRPDDVRTEASLQGMTQIEAYDGKEGWKVSPFFGRRDPERMSADDVKALVEDAEMDGPLVDWQAKGNAVEYLGTEDVDGTPAHKLKVTRKRVRTPKAFAKNNKRRLAFRTKCFWSARRPRIAFVPASLRDFLLGRGSAIQLSNHLRPRRTQHRLRNDERTHLSGCGDT